MQYRLMIDASNPPNPAAVEALNTKVQNTLIIAGYIGGDTPHVWTQSEWESYSEIPGKVGIFVPPQNPAIYNGESGVTWGHNAMDAMPDYLPVDAVVVIDIEHAMWTQNPIGVNKALGNFVTTLQTHEYQAGVYAPYDAFLGWPQVPDLAWVSGTPNDFLQPPALDERVTSYLQSIKSLAPFVAWQYLVSQQLDGSGVDYSLVMSTTTEESPIVTTPHPTTTVTGTTTETQTKAEIQKETAQAIVDYITKTWLE